MAERRVLMLALDALDISIIDRFCDEGRLPNIAAFRRGGHELGVNSDGEILHGSVWQTFASGTRPGNHGSYFWTQWLAEEQRHVRNNHPAFAFEPFWADFPSTGKRVTTVDIPYVPLIEGPGMRGVVGWGLHDEVVATSQPATFRGDVERRVGRNPLSFDTLEPQGGREKLEMARRLRLGVKRRAALMEQLVREGDWDLLITTFGEFHMAGHYLSLPQSLSEKTDNVAALAAIARAFDEALPRIVEAAGPNCDIFIFGLHGMRPQVDYAHFGRQIVDVVLGRPPLDTDAHPDLIRRIRNAVPDGVHRAIWKRLPARFRAARQGQISLGRADASTDPLFTLVHDSAPAFRLNLAGRELAGKLTVAEGEQKLLELEAFVTRLVTDDGRPAFESFIRPAVAWPGERSTRLPDAFAAPNREVVSTTALRDGDSLTLRSMHPEARNGAHTGRGFCFVRPGGAFDLLRDSVDAKDFAPTVIQLLGAPPPDRLEGTSFAR